jgi:hypothetical protein
MKYKVKKIKDEFWIIRNDVKLFKIENYILNSREFANEIADLLTSKEYYSGFSAIIPKI